ncbi:hypothetical protein DFJ73DRAFT_353570 [Zopfochytrium polystomum]|nr:hypothetical protein DFJ73DRAFT_353570 [Zopfochytrium polystomum]
MLLSRLKIPLHTTVLRPSPHLQPRKTVRRSCQMHRQRSSLTNQFPPSTRMHIINRYQPSALAIVASSDDAAAISDDELDEEDDEQPQNRGVNPMDDFDPEDLKNPRAPELDYCPLCFNIPNRAKLLTCCGNRIICSICARNWLQKHKTCPFCRTRIRASKRATGLEDAVAQQTLINELDVICPYEDAGCDWIGLRKNVKQHLVEDCVVAFDRETGERAAGTLPIAEFALDVVLGAAQGRRLGHCPQLPWHGSRPLHRHTHWPVSHQ